MALLILGFLLFVAAPDEFSWKEIISSVLYSVVTAIFVSLFYDLFTRSEQSVLQDISNDEVVRRLEKARINADAVSDLDSSELIVLAGALSSSESFAGAVAHLIHPDDDVSERLVHSHIRPLLNSKKIERVSIENSLLPHADKDSYLLHCRFRFVAGTEKQGFTCVVTPDNDVVNEVIVSSQFADEVIGLSEEGWQDLEALLSSLRMQCSWVDKGQRVTEEIKPKIMREADVTISYPKFKGARVAVLSFDLSGYSRKCDYTLDYKIRYSLKDNFYCWFATVPMFVDRIVMNYSGVANRIGKVAALSFVGTNSGETRHRTQDGVFEVDVAGLLWPGQGSMIIWKEIKEAV
jgi:hypothetical protein